MIFYEVHTINTLSQTIYTKSSPPPYIYIHDLIVLYPCYIHNQCAAIYPKLLFSANTLGSTPNALTSTSPDTPLL